MEEQDYIQFENYLLGDLSEIEKVSFETRLKDDSKFKESFNTYKELTSFLENKFENETKALVFNDNLQNISSAYFNKTKTHLNKKVKFKTFNFYKYAIAASVLLFFGIFMFNEFSKPSYSDYSNYGTINLTVRGNNDALLQTAENAFNSKDFAKADKAFKSLLVLDANNAEFILYRAIANLELNHFEEADDLLNNLQKGNSVYKNKASWYLALSKLKQNENEYCIEILKTIPKDAEDYNVAQKLLRKLD